MATRLGGLRTQEGCKIGAALNKMYTALNMMSQPYPRPSMAAAGQRGDLMVTVRPPATAILGNAGSFSAAASGPAVC